MVPAVFSTQALALAGSVTVTTTSWFPSPPTNEVLGARPSEVASIGPLPTAIWPPNHGWMSVVKVWLLLDAAATIRSKTSLSFGWIAAWSAKPGSFDRYAASFWR